MIDKLTASYQILDKCSDELVSKNNEGILNGFSNELLVCMWAVSFDRAQCK